MIESDNGSSLVKDAQLEVFGCNRQFGDCELLEVIVPITLSVHHISVPKYPHYQFGVTSVNCLHGSTVLGDIFR